MNIAKFPVFSGLAVPARRALGHTGPRKSDYPIDDLAIGQMFVVQIEGKEGAAKKNKDGTTTALSLVADTLRKARQKQSQIAALAKSRKMAVESRFFTKGIDLHPELAEYSNIVAVWRVEPKPAAVEGTPPETATPEIAL